MHKHAHAHAKSDTHANTKLNVKANARAHTHAHWQTRVQMSEHTRKHTCAKRKALGNFLHKENNSRGLAPRTKNILCEEDLLLSARNACTTVTQMRAASELPT